MEEFLKFFDKKVETFPMHLEVYYGGICDWCVDIWKEGCADNYPKSKRRDKDAIICNVQSCDIELAFAKAHVALKEWLSEFEGGY